MKNWIKLSVAVIALAAIIAGAVLLYDGLKDEYKVMPETKSETQEKTNPAPDFTVYDIEGNPVKLSDFKGKPVVLNFWATWCHYCKEGLPGFEAMYKKYPNVQFLMVNATDGYQETMEGAQGYIDEKGYTFDVFFDVDSDAVTTYGVNAFPATAFINKEGQFVHGVSGMIDESTLEKYIAEIAD